MKKTYVNPNIRVVNVECDALLALSSKDDPANPGQPIGSRRSNDWDEEDW